MDPSQQSSHPQRLSALYQYHNAPEVAPTQGLEFDDTIYPVSDKYPVIQNHEQKYTGKHAFVSDNRPPRIIFGMKVKTFLLVTLLVIGIVVGAAVGGAVGGRNMNSDSATSYQGVGSGSGTAGSSSSSATPSPTAVTSTYAAPTPTYSPLSDCPASNATAYDSQLTSESNVSASAGLNFTKYCGLESPLTSSGAEILSQAFVYTFNDCIELCASLNHYAQNRNCTLAVYQPGEKRPANCRLGSAAGVQASTLSANDGTDVAFLDAQ